MEREAFERLRTDPPEIDWSAHQQGEGHGNLQQYTPGRGTPGAKCRRLEASGVHDYPKANTFPIHTGTALTTISAAYNPTIVQERATPQRAASVVEGIYIFPPIC